MANSCIAQHTPDLATRHKELVDGGIMTDKEARNLNIGGEVLCYVY